MLKIIKMTTEVPDCAQINALMHQTELPHVRKKSHTLNNLSKLRHSKNNVIKKYLFLLVIFFDVCEFSLHFEAFLAVYGAKNFPIDTQELFNNPRF